MDFGNKIVTLRKSKKLSREQLAKQVGTSGAIIGRYERNEITPSVEVAAKISEALQVTLDYLVGKSSLEVKDKKMLDRLENIAGMPENKRTELFNVIDAYLRDFITKQAYL